MQIDKDLRGSAPKRSFSNVRSPEKGVASGAPLDLHNIHAVRTYRGAAFYEAM
jgi:hypothetical protein